MKQWIRDRLENGVDPNERRSSGYGNGDTYDRYKNRCFLRGLRPKEFREWLAYELQMDKPEGPHRTLDVQQSLEAALRGVTPIGTATVCPTVAKS
jgi:hypothetical protein